MEEDMEIQLESQQTKRNEPPTPSSRRMSKARRTSLFKPDTPKAVDENIHQDPQGLLSSMVHKLIEDFNLLRVTVFETITSFYREFVNISHYSLDLQSEVNSKGAELEKLLEMVSGDENAPPEVVEKMKNMEQLFELLNILAQLHNLIQLFDDLLHLAEFEQAIISISQIESLLENLKSYQHNDMYEPSITEAFEDQYIKKRSSIKYRLRELFKLGVSLNKIPGGGGEMIVTFCITASRSRHYIACPVNMELLFTSLAMMNMLPEIFDLLSENLLELFLFPVINDAQMEVKVTENHFQAKLVVENPNHISKRTKITRPDLDNLIEKIVTICSFLDSYLLKEDRKKLMSVKCHNYHSGIFLGKLWWERLWVQIRDKCLVPSIPDEKPNGEELNSVARKLLNFEDKLVKMGFFPAERRDISEFIRQYEYHFSTKRRSQLLGLAREILLSNDLNTVQVDQATERGGLTSLSEGKQKGIGTDPNLKSGKEGKEGQEEGFTIFNVPNCQISVQAQMLTELCYQTLAECQSDARSSMEHFCAVRDILDLYRAIIPSQWKELLETNPARSMIFFNDCMYFAHHLVTMGYQYKDYVHETIRPFTTFVDMVPLFRDLGQVQFKHELRKQRDIIINLLAKGNGLGDAGNDKVFDQLESILQSIIYQLNHVSAAWKTILPRELYLDTMGKLLDVLMEIFTNSLLNLETISMEDSFQLRFLFLVLDEACKKWFEFKQSITSISIRPQQLELTKIPIPKHSKYYEKCQLLFTKILSMEEMDLKLAIENNSFVYVTPVEANKILLARFPREP